MRVPGMLGLWATLAVGGGVAQRVPVSVAAHRARDAASTASQIAPEPGIGSPLGVAAGLGLLGWGLGALAGHAVEGDCFVEYCEFEGIFYGGAAGGGLGLALGAHLGNRRRGSLVLDVLTSGAVWLAGYAAMRSFADAGDGVGLLLTAVVLPPTQLLATVLVERATGRSRARHAQLPR